MKKIVLVLILLLCLALLCACVADLPGMLPVAGQAGASSAPQSQSAPAVLPGQGQGSAAAGQPAAPQSAPSASAASPDVTAPDYPYNAEMMALVNGVLEAYASGALPEPMRYNTDYSGIHNAPPLGAALPQAVSRADVRYELQSGGAGPSSVVVSMQLENDYAMDVHIELDNSGAGRPMRARDVSFYDMQGTSEADFALAPRGGDFLHLRSDRLYATAEFEDLRTDGGIVSGSISWSRANNFLWIDIDSMRESFFYTYFVAADGTLQQDYPQKDWQRLTVINDERMLGISQSLYEQFGEVLKTAWADEST